jgi:hypothetical protein
VAIGTRNVIPLVRHFLAGWLGLSAPVENWTTCAG